MKVFALVGKSGTGKSHQSMRVARENNINYIIDDGLLISDNKILAGKSAKKEAKRLEKEGWVVSPGALPMEKQLNRSYLMQQEFDENLFPKYIIAEAQSIGENYDAAKRQAIALAKVNVAGLIQTEVADITKNMVSNAQMASEDAASIVETVSAGEELIIQSLGTQIVVTECYRVLKNNNKEVLVRIAYNAKMAKQAAKKAVREELKKKGENLQEQLDKVLGI